MATKKQLDRMRDAIWMKEQEERLAAMHGFNGAYERLRTERKALEEQLLKAKFGS